MHAAGLGNGQVALGGNARLVGGEEINHVAVLRQPLAAPIRRDRVDTKRVGASIDRLTALDLHLLARAAHRGAIGTGHAHLADRGVNRQRHGLAGQKLGGIGTAAGGQEGH